MASRPALGALVAGLVSLALGNSVIGGAAAEPLNHRVPPGSNSVQEYYWNWSDSLRFSSRAFIHTEYADQASLPELVVTVVPPHPRRLVYLEFFQDGSWAAENIVRTDANGVAVIDVDPFCGDNSWCNGTYAYRLKIGGLTAPVSITYLEH